MISLRCWDSVGGRYGAQALCLLQQNCLKEGAGVGWMNAHATRVYSCLERAVNVVD